jgi:hypothetical protein
MLRVKMSGRWGKLAVVAVGLPPCCLKEQNQQLAFCGAVTSKSQAVISCMEANGYDPVFEDHCPGIASLEFLDQCYRPRNWLAHRALDIELIFVQQPKPPGTELP